MEQLLCDTPRSIEISPGGAQDSTDRRTRVQKPKQERCTTVAQDADEQVFGADGLVPTSPASG